MSNHFRKHFRKRLTRRLQGSSLSSKNVKDSVVDKFIQMTRKLENVKAEITPCSLSFYREMVQDVPLPNTQQKHNFAEFVAHAHSWYKHLPLYQPGVPFQFYIDKYAGYGLVVANDGTAKFIERRQRGFHYSDIPTDEYRMRFGYLAYACNAGTNIVVGDHNGVIMARDKTVVVSNDGVQTYGLPPEITEVGMAQLTAVIHTLSGALPYWDEYASKQIDRIDWPQESGGRAILEKIFAQCRMMREDPFKLGTGEIDHSLYDHYSKEAKQHLFVTDPVLHDLLLPERKRQYGEMVKAMDRVCDIVEGYKHK